MRIPMILLLFLAGSPLDLSAREVEGRPRLSTEERLLAERLLVQQEQCTTDECREQAL